ncbi:hypothetical protein FDUTEX481_08057 [Tolypothrix sp. PCC 7601]|nr:hypothetical protein FDUTEX481_08057 [Tolypothrix sp. PCC 7601]
MHIQLIFLAFSEAANLAIYQNYWLKNDTIYPNIKKPISTAK